MRIGIDMSFAGTTANFNEAANAGIEWVGEYFGGAGAYHVWTNNDRAALANSKIPYRLPIWVPNQSFASNPQEEANQALEAFHLLGFKNVMAVDIEEGSGYTLAWGEAFGSTLENAGVIGVGYHNPNHTLPPTLASWIALWIGNAPASLPSRTAQQYRGATNSYGMNVDFNVAADDFPLEGMPFTSTTKGTTLDIAGLPKGKLNAPIMAVATTSDKTGGWLVGADGGVFTWGSARFYGSAYGIKLWGPIVAIVPAPDDEGYTLVGSDGGTFRFGHGPDIPSLA